MTDTTKPGQGVLDAAISPDGKQMAVVGPRRRRDARSCSWPSPTTSCSTDAKPLGVRACKVIWRPDGEELVVVRADDCFGSATGELLRLPRRQPDSDQQSLKLSGDNPAFQPLAAE